MALFRKTFKPGDEKVYEKENLIQNLDYRLKIEPSFRDSHGRSLLHLILKRGKDVPDEVEGFIAAGCDVNAQDLQGNLPVHIAAEAGLLKSCKKIIYKNSLLDVFNKDDFTPLMLACHKNQPEVATLLLQHGANPNILNSSCKRSALHYAVEGRSKDCVKILIESRAKFNVKDAHGDNALILAAKHCVDEAVAVLLRQRGINLNSSDVHGRTALHWAASNGCLDICRLLVDAGIDLDLADKMMETAFLMSLKRNKTEIVKYLIDKGCDRFSVDGLNGTPLALAALFGLANCVKILIDAGDDPDALAFMGKTALMMAIFESHLDTVKCLLELGANPNTKSRDGKTALCSMFLAIDNRNDQKRHEILKLLLRAGADVNVELCELKLPCSFIPEGFKIRCLAMAVMTGYVSMARMLITAGAVVNDDVIKVGQSPEFMKTYQYEMKEFSSLFCEAINQPRSLLELSRLAIRRSVGAQPQKKIQQLPLAKVLIQYVDFKDLDAIPVEKAQDAPNLSSEMMTVVQLTPCNSAAMRGSLLSTFVRNIDYNCPCDICKQYRESIQGTA